MIAEIAAALAGRVSPATPVRCAEPLAKRTTLRVGGPADLFVEPASDEDLAAAVRFCGEQRLEFFVLGRGSNLLVRDGGFRGVVISLASPHFSRVTVDGERLRCGAGAKLKEVSAAAKRTELGGLEFLEGIPGSVGGALRMNAGAMGGATFDFVESVRVMDVSGLICELSRRAIEVEYRSCPLFKTHIALGAVFHGQPAPRAEIEAKLNEFNRKRWEVQPAKPSAGCTFKNPSKEIPAGKLVDELGLKGARVGGALVSAEHGNFIVNDGGATAADVLRLIEIIRQHAQAERGINLETEVEIIGED
ncbi:MAG: UDP-N-acetylmuramate dehydrogenase [Verrucomicrobia bacterium]|nr:UDP-N-acetylmuramate dehydrogenase [Verrucomicrobiota bacterium]